MTNCQICWLCILAGGMASAPLGAELQKKILGSCFPVHRPPISMHCTLDTATIPVHCTLHITLHCTPCTALLKALHTLMPHLMHCTPTQIILRCTKFQLNAAIFSACTAQNILLSCTCHQLWYASQCTVMALQCEVQYASQCKLHHTHSMHLTPAATAIRIPLLLQHNC